MHIYHPNRTIGISPATPYRRIIENSRLHLLRDGRVETFSERHIQCIWFDPALRPKLLSTRTGEQVVVMDPGRWNQEAGPDFLDATLLIKPELRYVQGDVEIHVHPLDWEHHHHARDPRYNRVVAHVTLFPSLGPPSGLPPGTLEIALESARDESIPFRMDRIDTSAYPFAARMPQCACGILLCEPSNIDPRSLLHAAGCYRLEQKANTMAQAIHQSPLPDVLYLTTMETLGYKQHTQAFATIARSVPLETIREQHAIDAYALLLGAAGLLPSGLPPDAPTENQAFLRKLWDKWWHFRSDAPAEAEPDWSGPSGRPTNNPARRLAAAATLFTRPDPWQDIMTALHTTKHVQALRALFNPPEPLSFWLSHATLAAAPMHHTKALVGNSRIAAWINNAVLPLAIAAGCKPNDMLPFFMPEQTNTIIRQTAARLFGRDHNPALYRTDGLLQQGLIQIFQDFCQHGCHACALADALRQGGFEEKECRTRR